MSWLDHLLNVIVGGDLSGTSDSATVVGLQKCPVDATPPTDGQELAYDNASGKAKWRTPAAVPLTTATVTASNSPFQVTTEDIIYVDSSTGACTVKLPASLSVRRIDVFDIGNQAASNNVTIDGNSHNVQDPNKLGTPAATVLITVSGASLTLTSNPTFWSI